MTTTDLFDEQPTFQLKGTMIAITVLELVVYDKTLLKLQLAEKVAQAPNFFGNTPMVIALDKLQSEPDALNLEDLHNLCRQHGLQTLAVRTDRPDMIEQAAQLDLAVLPPSRAREKAVDPGIEVAVAARQLAQEKVAQEKKAEADKEAEKKKQEESMYQAEQVEPEDQATIGVTDPLLTVSYQPSKIITTPVRSGQQVHGKDCDLIVLAPVSAGAELLADGNIHVYGPMRGRAMAGISGDRNARIFCHQLGAELLSIAGVFKTAEDMRRDPQWGGAVQAVLAGEELKIVCL